MEYKKCTKCKKLLPLSDFHKDRGYYRPRCKECRKQENRVWNKTNAGRRYKREYKRRLLKSKDKRLLARRRLQHYIYTNKIKREPCVVCGNKKSEGHHFDYSNPLNVVWLCTKHHAQIHSGELTTKSLIKLTI